MKKLVLPSLVVVSLAVYGCTNSAKIRADAFQNARRALVGKTKENILECAGIPTRSAQSGSSEFLTYQSGGVSIKNSHTSGWGNRPSSFLSASQRTREDHMSCEITFVINANKVKKVTYTGNTSNNSSERGEQCYYALQSCIEP